jgi:hypothetical protein
LNKASAEFLLITSGSQSIVTVLQTIGAITLCSFVELGYPKKVEEITPRGTVEPWMRIQSLVGKNQLGWA